MAQDILPYVCYYEDCLAEDIMYSSSDDLARHIDENHAEPGWVCTKCVTGAQTSPSISDNLSSWITHTQQEHEITLNESEFRLLADACQRNIPTTVVCPLCAEGAETSAVNDQYHIPWHVHQFALKCFPWDVADTWSSAGDADTMNSQERMNEAIDEDTETEENDTQNQSNHEDEEEPLHEKQHMGLRANINDFLDKYRGSSTGQKITMAWLGNDGEISDTFFRDATWNIGETRPGDVEMPDKAPDMTVLHGTQSTTSTATDADTSSEYQATMLVPSVNGDSTTLREEGHEQRLTTTASGDLSTRLPRIREEISGPQKFDIAAKTSQISDQIRGDGACIKCRLQRISCSTTSPCETCKRAYPQYHQTPEVCCIRYELSNVANDLAFSRCKFILTSSVLDLVRLIHVYRMLTIF